VNDDQSSTQPQISFEKELWRKATHTGALIIPAGYSFFNLEQLTMLAIMTPFAIATTIIDLARLRHWPLWNRVARPLMGPLLRNHEVSGDFSGATYILWSVVATVGLYRRDIAVAALAFIVVGDTLAALIGRKFGRHKFGRKSLEGSLACLAGTLLVAFVAPGLPLSMAVFGAFVATIVEAFSGPIDDNVSVPLVSGLAMLFFEKLFGLA
jgi:dolichol kinase